MALRKLGKYYHAYFVQWERDGTTLRKRQVQRCLYTDDLNLARVLENKLMSEARTSSTEAKAAAKIEAILTGTTATRAVHAPRRLKIADALDRAARYRDLGETSKKHWRRFTREIGLAYMDEVTPETALAYLDKVGENGKNYNNIRSALNGVYKLLLIDAGLRESPFERIPPRKVSTLSQRPFTREEYNRILAVAPSPWKEAVQIAWHTGMREKDVFTLRWSEINGDRIQKIPAKTARFRRAVVIFIHPHLKELLDSLPRKGDRVLGNWPYKPNYVGFATAFTRILEKAGIPQITPEGRATFNSFRNTFISRCDAFGVPRHATRSTVGHVKDDQTDLYSHDETSARMIQLLPD